MARGRGMFANKKTHSGASVCPACDCLCTVSEAQKAQRRLNEAAGTSASLLELLREQLMAANDRIATLEAAASATEAEKEDD